MAAPLELGPHTLTALRDAMTRSQAIGPTSLDWPAWVQAIGSILAILIAVGVAYVDVAQQRRRDAAADDQAACEKLRQRVRFTQSVALQVDESGKELAFLLDRYHNRPESYRSPEHARRYYVEIWRPGLDAVIKRLRWIAELPFGEWPDPELAIIFFNAVRALEVTAHAQSAEKLFGPFSLPETSLAGPQPLRVIEPRRYFSRAVYAAAFEGFFCIRDEEIAKAQSHGIDAAQAYTETAAARGSTVYERPKALAEAIAMDISELHERQ